MRLGHLGPAGTFTEEAARPAAEAAEAELVPYPTVLDALDAVLDRDVEAALVPVENSLEGTVTATVDALSAEDGLAIVGEATLPITQCLIARADLPLGDIRAVLSHPHALAQCARFLRRELPGARVVPVASTAEAVRALADEPPTSAAIASAAAAVAHGGHVLRQSVEDEPGNETRFVWVARSGSPPWPARDGAWKTSLFFSGSGDDSPGWLVRCLSEFAFRGVNLVRIESRPARSRLGHYIFLADCEGRASDESVADALRALHAHCDRVRVVGSYPAAPRGQVS